MSESTPETAAAVDAAALLDLAMNESQAPVDELGSALARMSRALSGACQLVEGKRADLLDATAKAHLQRCREAFEREVALCIESLQFHDRMMQQLTHARNCLAAPAAGTSLPSPSGQRAVDAWMTRHAAEGSIELF
jgi:hypothetical protein